MQFLGYSLYLPEHKTIVVSDLHLGQEESLHARGVLIPKRQFADIRRRLSSLFSAVSVDRIVLNGDVKHEFGTITNTEWREIRQLFEFLKEKEIILVAGNHDMVLKPIAEKHGIAMVRRYQLGEYVCIHGDKIETDLAQGVTTLIMGHEHPCVSFRAGARMEKYKCFLVGTYKQYKVIVTPSFTTLTLGTDVLSQQILSPYLKDNLEDFEVHIPDKKESKYFGTVKELVQLQETID